MSIMTPLYTSQGTAHHIDRAIQDALPALGRAAAPTSRSPLWVGKLPFMTSGL